VDTARIADLLQPFLEQSLSESQLHQISTYVELLLRWNARINLTGIRKEEEIITRHFGESLFLARHLFPADHGVRTPRSANTDCTLPSGNSEPLNPGHAERTDAYPANSRPSSEGVLATPPDPGSIEVLEGGVSKLRLGGGVRVLDIGSGAGFPALPLKIWSPDLHLTLIESTHKKTAFLREVARALTLTNIDVITERVEALAGRPDLAGAAVVTFRAVERFETVLPRAAAFLAPNATLALLISEAQIPHLDTLTILKWQPPIPVPQSLTRVLSIGVRH